MHDESIPEDAITVNGMKDLWKQVQMYHRSRTIPSTCIADASWALTRWRHFSAWSDVMDAILADVKSKIRLRQSMSIYFRTFLPNFIHIRFETTEPWAFLKTAAPTRTRTTRWDEFWSKYSKVAVNVLDLSLYNCTSNMRRWHTRPSLTTTRRPSL